MSELTEIRNLGDLCDFFHADSPLQLNERIYNATECGASISIVVGPPPETHANTFRMFFGQFSENSQSWVRLVEAQVLKDESFINIDIGNLSDNLPADVIDLFSLLLREQCFWHCEGFNAIDKFRDACMQFMVDNKRFHNVNIEEVSEDGGIVRVAVSLSRTENSSLTIHDGDTCSRQWNCCHCSNSFSFLPFTKEAPTCECGHVMTLVETTRKLLSHYFCDKCDKIFPVHSLFDDGERCPSCNDGHIRESVYTDWSRQPSQWDIPIDTPLLGFTIQTIVEGSDVTVDGEYMECPVPVKEVEEWIRQMEETSKFYWERDNWKWLIYTKPDGKQGTVEQTWDGFNWSDERHPDVPLDVREAIETVFDSDGNGFYSVEYGKDIPVPGFDGWHVHECLNECTY